MKQLTFILIAILFISACKMDVEYCDKSHPHKGRVQFCFNWAAQYAIHPQYMDVKAQRVVMHNNYMFETTTFATGNDSTRIIETPDSTDSLIYVKSTDPTHHVLHLRAGEYTFLAYNGKREGFNMSGDTISEPITDDLATVGSEFIDFNDDDPHSQYLITANSKHLFSATANLNIPLDVSGDPIYTVTFTPRPLTQDVNINFNIKPKESGIVVDKITCCISGVCRTMLISTREVFYDRTYKVLYEPTFSQDSKYMADFGVKGSIRVPGIVPNSSPGATTGPGILQVKVYIHFNDGNKIRYKTLTGVVNLYNLLAEAPSLAKSEQSNLAKQTKSEITLNIGSIMVITRSRIENDPDINIDKWVDKTNIGVDF